MLIRGRYFEKNQGWGQGWGQGQGQGQGLDKIQGRKN